MVATALQTVVEKAYYRIAPMLSAQQKPIYRFEIETMVSNALNRLADRIAEGPDYEVLQKTFPAITAASTGVFALDATMIPRSIPMNGDVLPLGESYRAQFLPHVQDLEMGGRPIDFKYYTIKGVQAAGNGTIILYKSDGTLATNASIIVRANYYPVVAGDGSMADLPAQLQDDLVDVLVGMCKEKMQGAENGEPAAPGGGGK